MSLEKRYRNVRVLTANFWSAMRSGSNSVSTKAPYERLQDQSSLKMSVRRGVRTGVRPFVKLCRDPLDGDLFEQKQRGTQVQAEENLGNGARYILILVTSIGILLIIDEGIPCKPTGESPRKECHVAKKVKVNFTADIVKRSAGSQRTDKELLSSRYIAYYPLPRDRWWIARCGVIACYPRWCFRTIRGRGYIEPGKKDLRRCETGPPS